MRHQSIFEGLEIWRGGNGQAHTEGWEAERATTEHPHAHVQFCCLFPEANPVRVLQAAVNRQVHGLRIIV